MDVPQRNFILGAGETLVEVVPPPRTSPRDRAPYTVIEARRRLQPRLVEVVRSFERLPDAALPEGEAVAKLILHPQFLSKSAFPSDLLHHSGLRAIGSKPVRVIPDKVARKSVPREEESTMVFVAGSRSAFERLAEDMDPAQTLAPNVAEELTAVEAFDAMIAEDRLRLPAAAAGITRLECVLHAGPNNRDRRIVEAFRQYARSLGIRPPEDDALFASGLCFLAVQGDAAIARELAHFTFLRVVRPMPRMRPLLPARIVRSSTTTPVLLPNTAPADPDLVVGTFDVPLPHDHAIGAWTTRRDYGARPYDDPALALHGLCVASAALFGPLDGVRAGDVPYALEHHGVLGEDQDEGDYHQVLKTVQKAVLERRYPLFNLSFGPQGAILDEEVDAFTAVLDGLVADGSSVAFVAVGNDGDLDDAQQSNRIQAPSDAVNVISVGATDTRQDHWQRAEYSCVGPGRAGGRVKPDLVRFGGSANEPFGCAGSGSRPIRYDTRGTSFASPSAMRTAGMVLASLGNQLTPVGLKALLIHAASAEERELRHVGHGLLPDELAPFLLCDDDEVRVLYQGKLQAGKYVSHTIPMPAQLLGMIEVSAVLCFATPVDPEFPPTYGRAGIDATFRPNATRRTTDRAQSSPLFSPSAVYGGSVERRDSHHWDTALKARRRVRARTLHEPRIDLHHNHRVNGQAGNADDAPEITYALLIGLRARQMPDLYNQVRARFGAALRVIVPRAEIAIRI